MVRSYRDLHVWRRAVDLTVAAYDLARALPADERHALSSQLRRAAVSVATNIAEGCGLTTRASFRHHLRIARGSLLEVETLLILGVRTRLLNREQCGPALALCEETSRMITVLLRKLGT